jgi:hypothetical protein
MYTSSNFLKPFVANGFGTVSLHWVIKDFFSSDQIVDITGIQNCVVDLLVNLGVIFSAVMTSSPSMILA